MHNNAARRDKTNDDMDKISKFKAITQQMADTYEAKNTDYGDSFGKSIEKYGPVAGIVRMSDKFNRLENLLLNQGTAKVNDESVIDTLTDLANYAIMLRIELETKPNYQII